MKVVVVDYGLGNLRSVAGAVERLGAQTTVSSDPTTIQDADRLILPGVGAFADGMANLRARGLVDALQEAARGKGRPVLGICLGAQLMARESEEFGLHPGLGWLDARVVRLAPVDQSLRIPHVGWNDVSAKAGSVLFQDVPERSLFYFVHSFHIDGMGIDRAAMCDYGQPFTAAFEADNLYGTQFHPEKSQLQGLQVLRNFLERT